MNKVEREIIDAVEQAIHLPETQKGIEFSERDHLEIGKHEIRYYLHNTPVVRVLRNKGTATNVFVFRAGNWQTHTTKRRINAFIEYFFETYGIHQKDFVWYWHNRANAPLLFKDNDMMFISPKDGKVTFARGDSEGNPVFPYDGIFAEEGETDENK